MSAALLASVFLIATCGLVYELLAGTVASYLLGDTVTQFSTIIGTYLFAMGVGSYLAKFVRRGLIARFIHIEVLVGLFGGVSAALLFISFQEVAAFRFVLYALVGIIGMLVGTEIPLLLRILKDQLQFSDLVSKVLSLDYLGALVASLAFPLLLMPHLGLVRASFAIGMLNVAVAIWTAYMFRTELRAARWLALEGIAAFVLLGAGFVASDRITRLAEGEMYADQVIFSTSTKYQRIVVTKSHDELRLYLNGHLQFSSFDEYRYHEALVHPGLAAVERPERVLVLGGGDGLAVREILKDGRVREVLLVDLDHAMTDLFRQHSLMATLNNNALSDPRVRVENHDAFVWLRDTPGLFDFIVIDFPDPSSFAIGKLYTHTFYAEIARHLAPGGRLVVQSTSPLFARQSYWCIHDTIQASGFLTAPYHAYVPSFGEWGFVLAGKEPYRLPAALPANLRFLDSATLPTMFEFSRDMQPLEVETNRLQNQALVRYYDDEWKRIDR